MLHEDSTFVCMYVSNTTGMELFQANLNSCECGSAGMWSASER